MQRTATRLGFFALFLLVGILIGIGGYRWIATSHRPDINALYRSGNWRPAAFTPAPKNPLPESPDMDTLIAVNRALTRVVEHVRDAVVVVKTSKTITISRRPRGIPESPFEWFFEWPRPRGEGEREFRHRSQGIGSGVIISPDGYILTNNHVIEDADEITVYTVDRRDFSAKLVGADPSTDLAVLKIDGNNLPTIPFGDSDQLKVGEFVIAIGAPFDQEHSVSFGIVSAKGRSGILPRLNPERLSFEDFIQTDAAINPGNSGGPLVNIRGELIGINTAISSTTGQYAGIGFAIASNLAQKVLRDLVEKGKVVRAWLGVYLQDVDDDVAEKLGLERPYGAQVVQVISDSPAEKGGLKPLDIIIEVDGREVSNVNAFRNYISTRDPGTRVRLVVLRDGKRKTLTVRLGTLDETKLAQGRESPTDREAGWTGLVVEELTPEKAEELGYEGPVEGVLVAEVVAGSPADQEGMSPGMVILEVEGQPVRTPAEFRKAVEQAGDSVLIKWRIRDRIGDRFGITVLKKPR